MSSEQSTAEVEEPTKPTDESVEAMKDVLRGEPESSELTFLGPTKTHLTMLASAGNAIDGMPSVRVVTAGEHLRELRRDFLKAAEMGTLMEAGDVALRAGEVQGVTPILVADETVYAPLLSREEAVTVSEADPEFVSDANDHAFDAWESSDDFSLRTPGLDRLTETLETDVSPVVRDDFEASLKVARGLRDRTDFHEITAAIVAGAKHGVLHYDLSKWGEDVGLGSKATFSRKKGQLEDAGVIETEKVPIDMGRPRQRLFLTDTYQEIAEDRGVAEIVSRVAT